ncbi:MAG TPA: hypothetical protein QGH28_08740 [Chloroflexota bacterium]|nr:hypothetical protein [Chloroflexota bacterium]
MIPSLAFTAACTVEERLIYLLTSLPRDGPVFRGEFARGLHQCSARRRGD